MSRLVRSLLALFVAAAVSLRAQDPLSDAPLNPAQVDQLLGPIALYPDALVALILPASTMPGDIVLAQRYLGSGGNPDQVDNQPWNESVKALARYPVLIKWLDENLTWTQQLGQVFISQPDDVMNAVQRLRARARASGALTSTAQQKLVLDGDVIEIIPAQPDVIYVPYYDPNVVYGGMPGYYYDGPYLTFGIGLPVGLWLSYDFNWHDRVIWVGDRHRNWHEHGDWNHHYYAAPGRPNSGNWHRWQPPANRPPYARPTGRPSHYESYRPSPFPGAPAYAPHDARPNPPNHSGPEPRGHESDRNRGPVPVNVPPSRPDSNDHYGRNEPRPGAKPIPPQPAPHSDRTSGPPVSPRTAPIGSPHSNAPMPPPAPAPTPRPDHAAPSGPRSDVRVPPPGNMPPPPRPEGRQYTPPPPPVHVAPPPPSKDNARDKDPQVAR
jgi:hypothetical protein